MHRAWYQTEQVTLQPGDRKHLNKGDVMAETTGLWRARPETLQEVGANSLSTGRTPRQNVGKSSKEFLPPLGTGRRKQSGVEEPEQRCPSASWEPLTALPGQTLPFNPAEW